MTNNLNFVNSYGNKGTNPGQSNTLSATEWNDVMTKLDELVTSVPTEVSGGNGTSSAIDTAGVVTVNSKGNTTISATKHVNIEPAYVPDGTAGIYGDVQIKPGDDITLESHHRAADKRDEITIKTSNGKDGDLEAPVKLQIIAADMTLSSKGKTGNDSNVTNVKVTTGSGKGYLKVRAQAIDLRCEEHGGIALQPKGEDNSHNMNKIKFEHGGGDGLEFGTFNTEKTSIFTDEYRFNKDGVWKMATRTKVVSDKADENDPTTAYKYVKAADDFYDNIDVTDSQCTTKDIIKTAYAMNGAPTIHTKITNKGALEIASSDQYELLTIPAVVSQEDSAIINQVKIGGFYSLSELQTVLGNVLTTPLYTSLSEAADQSVTQIPLTNGQLSFKKHTAKNIKIESGAELKLGGILDFGSSFNFGETDNGILAIKKFTKKDEGTLKHCDELQVIGVNNHANNNVTLSKVVYTPEDVANNTPASYSETNVTLTPGQTDVLASASLYDIIKLVNYMKANSQGPWASQL